MPDFSPGPDVILQHDNVKRHIVSNLHFQHLRNFYEGEEQTNRPDVVMLCWLNAKRRSDYYLGQCQDFLQSLMVQVRSNQERLLDPEFERWSPGMNSSFLLGLNCKW